MHIRFHIKMPSAPYNIAMLDAHFLCGQLNCLLFFCVTKCGKRVTNEWTGFDLIRSNLTFWIEILVWCSPECHNVMKQQNSWNIQSGMDCLRWIVNIHRPDRISNAALRKKTGKELVLQQLRWREWNGVGDTLRSDNCITKQAALLRRDVKNLGF